MHPQLGVGGKVGRWQCPRRQRSGGGARRGYATAQGLGSCVLRRRIDRPAPGDVRPILIGWPVRWRAPRLWSP